MLLPNREVGYGDLVVENGHIAAIDARISDSQLGQRASRPLQSLIPPPHPSSLILPGLVNCHGHTAMTLVRGLGSGLPLQRWLEEAIFPAEAKMTPRDVYAGNVWGILEMLAGGTTCVADMYDFPAEMERALGEIGMKGFVNRVGLSIVPGRLEDCIRFAEEHPKSHLCVHSEYLTDESFCRGLAKANEALRRPVHFHLSETEREHRECIARRGKTPTAYLAETGLFDHGGYAAHCVWCTDDDFRILAEKGVSLVHNPTSNMKLGSGFARICRARELGVNVALGTDGCASNDNLDMFEEMHIASLVHKGLAKDPTALDAWDVIEMATVNGAKAVGLENAGELRVGASADLCVVDLDRLHLMPAFDIPNLVVNSMRASDVVLTMVGGRVLYERGAFPTVDFAAAKRSFSEACERLS